MHDDDLITTAAACRLLGGNETPIHPATLWRWVKAGRISPPLRVGRTMVRYRRSRLIAERDCGRPVAYPPVPPPPSYEVAS